MPEVTSNFEFAYKIHEHDHYPSSSTHHRKAQWVEIMEAVVRQGFHSLPEA
jgi:hypothetical protein